MSVHREELQEILDLPVSVENIATYSDIISQDLIGFIGRVWLENGGDQADLAGPDGREWEDLLFDELGLPPLVTALDIIQERSDMVYAAGKFMTERAIKLDTINTPPDRKQTPNIGKGLQSFEQAGIKDRVLASLYILQKIGVDLRTVSLSYGPVTNEMVRESSYYTLVIPDLDKVLQVCDEEGNASYIFSSTVMDEIGLDVEAINNFSKSEKNELISIYRNAGLGHRFIYSQAWTNQVEKFLKADKQQLVAIAQQHYNDQNVSKPAKAPIAPPDYLSIGGLAQALGVSHGIVANFINRQRIELDLYIFSPRTVRGIPPVLQEIIKNLPEIKAQPVPAGAISIKKFAIELGIGRETLDEVIAENSVPTHAFKFKTKVGPGLLLEDQTRIREILVANPPKATDDIVSVGKIAKQNKVSSATIALICEELGIKPRQYKFRNITAAGFTSEQRTALLKHPRFGIPLAPPEVRSVQALAKSLHSSVGYINRLVAELKMPLTDYKFRSAITGGLDPEQQSRVVALFHERRPEAPGALTYVRLRQETGASYPVIDDILRSNDIEPIKVKRNTRVAKAVPADMVELVREEIKRRRAGKHQKHNR